jgi:hypothetical protein
MAEVIRRNILPGKKRFKTLVNKIVFVVLGRAIQTISRLDKDFRREVASWPDNYRFMMKILPHGGCLCLQKDNQGNLVYKGADEEYEKTADMVFYLRNTESAFMLFTAQAGIPKAYAEHRMSAKGDIAYSMSITRCFNLAQTYLFPRFLAQRIMRRVPAIPILQRYAMRARLYILSVPFGI